MAWLFSWNVLVVVFQVQELKDEREPVSIEDLGVLFSGMCQTIW